MDQKNNKHNKQEQNQKMKISAHFRNFINVYKKLITNKSPIANYIRTGYQNQTKAETSLVN
jgi:hypothetical protein